ncbi:HpaII family restriction endonuclease [Paramaledivibacter caminithermalis]|jgi:type II restriction enzyme|uniref:Type II restriction enzyme n=1 Tax=Paramaledivibacter caminithermalis (strain DSM 15212 / CIP 107654 / DViRD3) TaxID=1121301 RepID=A0A1M6M9T2_PARC5|nr:HpaII family restriction endonuclease [Paramaledivibacter caminithermalis]SHJ80201.1 type II restriction enzyme [Paramaledivibacter caminithermalis DSM 15212]
MWYGNKGEWSEVYTFLKLLSDGRLYAGDEDLNKIEEIYYPIIKILRKENDKNFEFHRNGNIKVVSGETQEVLLELEIEEFFHKSQVLLEKIYENIRGNFSVPEVEEFMKSIRCTKLKADNSDKTDITIVVHDIFTGYKPTLGFSIKSRLGNPSTLLNASQSTNFTFKLTKKISKQEVNMINNIDRTVARSYIIKRIEKIKELGCDFEFYDLKSKIFKNNLQLIDTELPKIIGYLLIEYYSTNYNRINELTERVKNSNPCKYQDIGNYPFYEHKIKNFLVDVALGMVPATPWNGNFNASGGYIIVKEDGDIVCYHIYNYNNFQEYLYTHTKLEKASSSRHGYGVIYEENGEQLIDFNLQIRFL